MGATMYNQIDNQCIYRSHSVYCFPLLLGVDGDSYRSSETFEGWQKTDRMTCRLWWITCQVFHCYNQHFFQNSEFLTLYYLTVVDYHQKCLMIEIQLAGFSDIKYRHYVVSIEEKKHVCIVVFVTWIRNIFFSDTSTWRCVIRWYFSM